MSFRPRLLRLDTALQVRRQLEAIQVDPCGVRLMTQKALHVNILLEQVSCVAANILKQEMLALGGDAAVARGTVACSIAHTDVLLMGTHKQLAQLIARLPRQPFGLKALAEELRTLLMPPDAARKLVGRRRQLDLCRPQVMGIINVTPDSFYDGGVCSSLDAVLRQAEKQVEAGADLFDVGGESTRPGAAAVSADVERARVVPVVSALAERFDLPVSVDTTKAVVAEEALDAGADFINDISGLTFDPALAEVVARKSAGVFIMHTRGCPQTMQDDTRYRNLLAEVTEALRRSVALALDAGIPSQNISIDPGIGFGKSVAGNLELLRRLNEIAALGYPVLVGTSRKSFIGKVLDQPLAQHRLYGSLASVVVAAQNGAQIFRVHDVGPTRQAVDLAWAINHETYMA